MNSDQFQDKYKEALQELKQERMDWDFEDFLKKTEEKTSEIPLEKPKPVIPKTFWMAASFALLLGLGIYFSKNDNITEADNNLIKNEVIRQKEIIGAENSYTEELTAGKDSAQANKDSVETDNPGADQSEKVLDRILSKRGRLKKKVRPKYAANRKVPGETDKNTEYQDNFVIINGQKIENEKEAIDIAKYSLQMLGKQVSKTVAKADALTVYDE